jgi:pimeloyl-ACP methyl ester carboxylesterase
MKLSTYALIGGMILSPWASLFAQCNEALEEARQKTANPIVVIQFDGLGTNEMGTRLLQRAIGSKLENRCSREHVTIVNFHYGKAGVERAMQCLESFRQRFGTRASFHLVGHSFGAGIGVINLLERSTNKLRFQNVVTFDPRGGTYRYSSPGSAQVDRFINIYQRTPLAGRTVTGASFEEDVTGKSGHVRLPFNMGDLALSKVGGRLSCAKN